MSINVCKRQGSQYVRISGGNSCCFEMQPMRKAPYRA